MAANTGVRGRMVVRLSHAALVTAALLAAGVAHAQSPAQPLQPIGSPPAMAPVSAQSTPTSIDDLLDQSTDEDDAPPQLAAPGLTSQQLDARILGGAAAAQSLQGPMDGAWSLQATADKVALYTFQFVDSPKPPANLEGAWRDLRRGDGLSSTGLIADVQRSGALLQASFYPKGGIEAASVSLIQQADGNWAGQLTQGGLTTAVQMVRSEPLLNVAPLRNPGSGVVSPYHTDNTRAAPVRKAKGKAVRSKSARKATVNKSRAKTGGAKTARAKKATKKVATKKTR